MKPAAVFIVVVSAIGASADSYAGAPPLITGAPTSPYSTQYEYYDACTDSGYESTTTDMVLHTYCPECEEGHGGSYGGGSGSGKSGILTTYQTVYSQFCSTGLQEKTFTVTESCSSTDQPRSTGYVPQGFTVTTATCHVCGSAPITAVLTTPVPAASTPGAGGSATPTSAAPTGPPASGGSPPQSAPPAGAPPAPSTPEGSVPPIAGGAPTAPIYPASRVGNGILPTNSPSSGSGSPYSSPVIPYTGAASSLSLGISLLVGLSGMIVALACGL